MTESIQGGVIDLSAAQLAVAAALILVAGAVSLALGLRIERRLGLAAVRTVVQLFLVGYVLRWVFGLDSAWAVGVVALFMVAMAARTAVARPAHKMHGATWRAFVSLVVSGSLTTVVVTALIVRVEPWYQPQYVIPLLGMILGNGLTGLSLCLDQLLDRFAERRDEIEMELALGASRWEAAREPLADAVRRGMIPIVNSMMIVGVVSLPGMMTGQILQGADPVVAVKYQIMVMFMIAAATSLSSMMIAWMVYRRMFNANDQMTDGVIVVKKRRA